jgi:hypothetical protein
MRPLVEAFFDHVTGTAFNEFVGLQAVNPGLTTQRSNPT